MKYLGSITNDNDLVNKKYVDNLAIDTSLFGIYVDNNGDLSLSYDDSELGTTSITPTKIGAVPTSRTINSKALSSDITLSASDVGALASADLYTRSSSGGLDWSTSTANMVIAKSALAYWNGSYDGTTSNLQRLNATVYVGGTQMKDFIKEQGTSSSWYYRKWNSGKIEAWRTYNAGSQTPSQWVAGSWYYKDIDIAIPSGIFSSAPNHTVATNNGSDYQYMVHVARATSATNIRVRCVKPNSGAATPVIALYVSNMV